LNKPLIIFHEHSSSRLRRGGKAREEAQILFWNKWKKDIEKIGGRNALEIIRSKKIAGSYFSSISTATILNGRISAFKLLFDTVSKKSFIPSYFLKSILIIIVGPYIYDLFRKWRGIIYWKLYEWEIIP
jgi:hypothetical protein